MPTTATPTLRGLTEADIPAWNRLLADVEAVDHTGEHYNEADLAEEMRNPDITLGKDLVGAFVGEELVGYFGVYPRSASEEYHKLALEGAVHPGWRGRGVGSQLVRAMMRRAEQAHAERFPGMAAMYALTGLSSNVAQERLLAEVGLLPDRWNFQMRADLSRAPEPAVFPAGLEVRPYDESMAAALRDAHNTAFLDHPHFTPWSEAMWKQWVTDSRNFRPDITFVVVDPAEGDRIVSYVQTSEYDAYFEATGRREAYVGKVGTLRAYRGRGLASSLLRHCLAAYRAAGYDEAALDVDSANPTGALGVYERAGFVVDSRWTNYARLDR